MSLVLVIGLVSAGLAVALVARAAMLPRLRASARLGEVQAYGFPADAPDALAADEREPGGPVTVLGEAILRRLPESVTEEIQRLLIRAGLYEVAPAKIAGYRALLTVGTPGFWLWFSTNSGMGGLVIFAGVVIATLCGWILPITLLRTRGERRTQQVEYALPEFVDILVVTVEAGLAFNSSLQLASQRLRGPLADEVALTLQEQRFGLPLPRALENMLDRCETPAMRSFVRSVLQGETLGVSIGDIMRNLAADMRTRRRQNAEQRAQRAPIKMLFPLVFLIFPPIFIVLLFPAGYALTQVLGSG